MQLQNAPIYYIKYKKEDSKDKALKELINKGGVAEVATKEKESELEHNNRTFLRR